MRVPRVEFPKTGRRVVEQDEPIIEFNDVGFYGCLQDRLLDNNGILQSTIIKSRQRLAEQTQRRERTVEEREREMAAKEIEEKRLQDEVSEATDLIVSLGKDFESGWPRVFRHVVTAEESHIFSPSRRMRREGSDEESARETDDGDELGVDDHDVEVLQKEDYKKYGISEVPRHRIPPRSCLDSFVGWKSKLQSRMSISFPRDVNMSLDQQHDDDESQSDLASVSSGFSKIPAEEYLFGKRAALLTKNLKNTSFQGTTAADRLKTTYEQASGDRLGSGLHGNGSWMSGSTEPFSRARAHQLRRMV